jgi:hypothetical protein
MKKKETGKGKEMSKKERESEQKLMCRMTKSEQPFP